MRPYRTSRLRARAFEAKVADHVLGGGGPAESITGEQGHAGGARLVIRTPVARPPARGGPSVGTAVPRKWKGGRAGGERPGQAGCVGARATASGKGNGPRAVISRWCWPAGLGARRRDLGRQRGARSGSPERLRRSQTRRVARA